MHLKGMKAVVCGAGGFIGGHLVNSLQSNGVNVIRDGGQLCCNAELGCATMVAIKLAVESYRQRKTLSWDAKAEKVVG